MLPAATEDAYASEVRLGVGELVAAQIDQLSFLEKALVNYPLRMNQILFLELIIQVGTDLIGLLKAMGSYYLKFELMVAIFSLNLGYTVEMGKQFDFLVVAVVVVGAREKETGIV
ncbi:unnamed protein product [[Candida] boidinii]|nr:unnamed protein product [[Candida] boidinii]